MRSTFLPTGVFEWQVAGDESEALFGWTRPLSCHRVLVPDDYLPTFNRQNVELVSEPIRRLEARGFRTADGTLREVDVIVYVTGFKVGNLDGFLDIVGQGGRELKAEWTQNGAQAYRGLNVSGFPNFAMLLGPNPGIAH
jgi:cation diffusion facilitator CzcD-associated flavoprotein CzcO